MKREDWLRLTEDQRNALRRDPDPGYWWVSDFYSAGKEEKIYPLQIVYVLPRHGKRRRIALQDGLKVGLSGLIMWGAGRPA